jgi:hypothetical protein
LFFMQLALLHWQSAGINELHYAKSCVRILSLVFDNCEL